VRLDDIPLFSMLKGRMDYLNARQKVVSENVANADTPGFTPRDLKPKTFDQVLAGQGGPVALAQTQVGHMPIGGPHGNRGMVGSSSAYQAMTSPDSETRMDGNSVVLEEEMMKMAESRMAYDAAVTLYQKSLGMLRLAARKPGG
jgi:flagellar basal-body rod protein FlgB